MFRVKKVVQQDLLNRRENGSKFFPHGICCRGLDVNIWRGTGLLANLKFFRKCHWVVLKTPHFFQKSCLSLQFQAIIFLNTRDFYEYLELFCHHQNKEFSSQIQQKMKVFTNVLQKS